MHTLMRSTTISFVSLGLALCASPALAATITRQDFNGNFTLLDSTSIADPFPESTDYSGFVTYDENNSLVDWAIDVEELNLSLNPDSNNFDTPDVTFDLSSESNWDLRIDFGIAVDAPLYEIERDSTEINFVANLGLTGAATYVDSDASIDVTSTNTTVPEPSTIFASLAFLATMTMLNKD